MRTIRRYEIACDGQPHAFQLCYDPIFVSASPFRDQLYFWAEHEDEMETYEATIQVFPTGDPLPEGYLWLGSVIKGSLGEAWHLIMLPPPESPGERPIMELIENSSLGTPGAKALRARTPREVTDRVLARARDLEEEGLCQRKDATYGS